MRELILILTLLLTCFAAGATDYRFLSAKTGKELPLAKLAAKLSKADIVFFGEYHDDAAIHAAQRELLTSLQAKDPRLALSFEMFERDVQPRLDAYLRGGIAEEAFLAEARPWGNYLTDYKPLVEFAKAKGLDCIAANVPRRLAGKVARSGLDGVNELSDADRVLAALKVHALPGRYRDNFLQTMDELGNHGGMGDSALLENMYAAQCLKDDTMAESLLQYRELHPKHTILHFNGDFHSRGFLGTVERVKLRDRKVKMAVISPLREGEDLPKDARGIADYFVVVPAPAAGEGK